MILLASQRHGWVAPVTGMLEWKNTGFLGRTGWEDEEVVLPSLSITSQNAWSSTWRWMRSQPRSYGSGLKQEQGQVTLWWGSTTGSVSGWLSEWGPVWRDRSSLMSTCGPPGPHGGLTPPKLSVGVATLQGIRNPGSSWNALRINSLLPMIKKPMRRGAGRQGENGGEYEVQGQPGLQ